MTRSQNSGLVERWKRRAGGLTLAAAVALGVLMFGGCSQERVEQGDPPAGYETWDDYWKAQDKLQQQHERERRLRLDRPGQDPTRPY